MNKTIASEHEERIKKLNELKKTNINPYPSRSNRTITISEIVKNFKKLEKDQKSLVVAGRLISKRTHGNLSFVDLQSNGDNIQIAVSKKEIGQENYKLFVKLIDMGDFVEFTGTCFVTHKGEQSIMATNFAILTKALQALPEKWHGLKDEEEKLRKRYLDILHNKDLFKLFVLKAKFWDATREFLKNKGFLEVETPTLENTTGGAEAEPFKTHHNDYDMDVYLRISVGELWQKRLMAAGFEKTFEIGRAYRNEGSSPDHLQEFTNMEFYWAFADYNDGMNMVQEMYAHIAKEVFGKTKFITRGYEYDLSGNWPRVDYNEEILKQTKIDIIKSSDTEIKNKLKELKVKYEGENRERLTDSLWKYCRKKISGPVFLINHPKITSPLAKENPDKPGQVQRFQIIIAGSEIGNGYSELNDPIEQRKRFEIQQKLLDEGDTEAMMPDWEFVEMLEHGMPPTCGFGFGIRLFAFLMDKPVREVTTFPLVKPKQSLQHSKSEAEIGDLGITYENAQKLLSKHIKEKVNKMHALETEAIMRGLAKYFKADEEKWGIVGLLHDLDWELTKDNPKEHCIKVVEILQNVNASDFLINTIISHCFGNDTVIEYKLKERNTKIQHLLAASETLSGLIISTALMQPDKKLTSVKISSLIKKFKNKKFAANCDRNIILECEKAGIELNEFLEIGLKSLQKISKNLDL